MDQYNSLIAPENIQYVNNLVDATLEDVMKIEAEIEGAYANRASLIKEIKQLEGGIQLEEANAFMTIAEDNTVQIDGRKVKLSNAEMRSMYQKYVTAETRKQLIEKQADLAEIDTNITLLKDRWDMVKSSANLVEARSWAQGNLLKFLSSKG
ncbi:hypothetical protein [Lysinibacillus sp. 54212]|uniref:hypothetical protein n=1 Tax=Lysinibacillus sp. 54212 TaxID=3119829 RepID=UPI002FC8A539